LTRILVTGGAGFSGSHLCDAIIEQTDWNLVVWDALTYAGDYNNLSNIWSDPEKKKRFEFQHLDFSSYIDDRFSAQYKNIDFICHAGAETHVRNSLENPHSFVWSNIIGTYNMLEVARKLQPKKFLYVSTDEVFGASLTPKKETDELNPSNPYSATKASGEMLVKSYQSSFGLPCLISRTSNIYGKRQHIEKYIPMVEKQIQNHEIVEIHTDAEQNVGSRQWIHASDQAAALLFLLQTNQTGVFHIAGERKTNVEIADAIAECMQKPLYRKYLNAYSKYAGHDLHYAIDDSKLRNLGWKPRLTFEEGLKLTV
jgi:dTDP-glucose 4,6-dehydratase